MSRRYVLHAVRRELPREWDEQMAKQRDQPCCDKEDGDDDEDGDDYLVVMMMKSYRL